MALLRLSQPRGHRETTVATFLLELAPSLNAMALDPRCFVMVAEFTAGHYVQFWVESDGQLFAETSAPCAGSAHDTVDIMQSRLAGAGWREPVDACTPNWWVVGKGTDFVLEVGTLISITLRSFMELNSSDRAFIHFWTPKCGATMDALVRLEARVSYHEALRALRRDLDAM
jgi:hypothetical protein